MSAGSFLAAALANGIPVSEIYGIFIEGEEAEGALTPEVFMRPAFREFLRAGADACRPCSPARSWQYLRQPFSRGALESFAALGRAIPTGVFDNETIHHYLEAVFTQPGRTNEFRKLRRKLYLVATDLDTGESVSFGRPGHDHVPISQAVQASAALPGLFPPVEIDGRFFVDGALKKTLHASEALDDGAKLVLCVNPIVPYDASLAAEKGRGRHRRLVDGGLPVVLSQTFRAIIHSRMAVGLSKYRALYRDADVVLFEPDADDSEIFFTNIFSYSTRVRLCEHAYQRTRSDLLRRRHELEPALARHGVRLLRGRPARPGPADQPLAEEPPRDAGAVAAAGDGRRICARRSSICAAGWPPRTAPRRDNLSGHGESSRRPAPPRRQRGAHPAHAGAHPRREPRPLQRRAARRT